MFNSAPSTHNVGRTDSLPLTIRKVRAYNRDNGNFSPTSVFEEANMTNVLAELGPHPKF